MTKEVLLEVSGLKKYFPLRPDWWGRPAEYLRAVDDVSFTLNQGETLGLVGESGCGKSTLGRTVMGLYPPTAGQIVLKGQNTREFSSRRQLSRYMQMIFQDPYASLNPRMTVREIVAEPLVIHKLTGKRERGERVKELLQLVGLRPEYAGRFPHEFSGGQRQRIGIARALALQPELIICDEPISALDVSVQAQVVNLLQQLQEELGLAYLFIAHDLAMVKYISQRVAVMYRGRIVEYGSTQDVYRTPRHPYTSMLLAAIPGSGHGAAAFGDGAGLGTAGIGCAFYHRCPKRQARCLEEVPRLQGSGHQTACHMAD